MIQKAIMCLFDASGNTSNYFKQQGYFVIQHDTKLDKFNAIQLDYIPGLVLDGLICYPPCTYFSKARKRPGEYDLDYGLSTLDLCFRIKTLYKPRIFIIENPFHSRIRNYIGPPQQKIELGTYGFPTRKETGLWGEFNYIDPGTYTVPKYQPKSIFQNMGTSKRAETPIQFVEYLFNSNFKNHNQCTNG